MYVWRPAPPAVIHVETAPMGLFTLYGGAWDAGVHGVRRLPGRARQVSRFEIRSQRQVLSDKPKREGVGHAPNERGLEAACSHMPVH